MVKFFIGFAAVFFLQGLALAANQGLTYQGRILKADGQPLQATSVQFAFTILDPSENCVLYSEAVTTNMAGSSGNFSLNVGSGTRLDGGSHTWKQVFMNAGTLSSLNCGSGSTYTPAATDERLLKVTFNDGSGAQAISGMSIRAVPFALQADQVSGYGSANLAKISGSGSANIFSPFQHDFLFNLSAASTASSTPCVTGEILKFNGTSWACGADNTGGSPGDASYAAKGTLQFNTDAATSGVTVASGVATVNTGFGANQIPKYDASANLGLGISPTSKLDVNGSFTQRGMAAPAASAAGTGRIYFDSTSNHFYFSENGGSYTQLSSATGALSSVSSISNSGGNITLAPTASTGSVLVNSGTASVGTASGALVVTGGIGASGSIYTGGSINAGTTVTATTSVYSPQIYGSSAASGTLSLDGTSHATKGDILMNISGGNVGIGTASPWKNLSIDATGANAGPIVAVRNSGGGAGGFPGFDANVYGGSGSPRIRLGQSGGTFASPTATTLGMVLGNIHFGGQGPSVSTPYAASITGYAEATFTDTSSPAYMIFSTTPSGSITQQERMRIDAAGNVGIGTTAPANIMTLTRNQDAETNLEITNSSSGGSAGAAFVAKNNSGGFAQFGAAGSNMGYGGGLLANAASVYSNMSNGISLFNDSGVAPITFATNASEKMRITSAGNVGIGTSSPSSKFEVVSSNSTTSGTSSLANLKYTVNPASSSTASSYGLSLAVDTATSGSYGFNDVRGINGMVSFNGPVGSLAEYVYGASIGSYSNGGTVSTLAGLDVTAMNSGSGATAAVSDINGIKILVETDNPATAINSYGINIYQSVNGPATVTNRYGIYIEADNYGTVTNDFGVYQVSDIQNNFFAGKVGISTTTPRSALDVSGVILSKASTSNSTTTIDFGTGNVQHTAQSCGSFSFRNLKDGGTYVFVVQGTTAGTCSFTGFSDNGSTAITMHMPPDNGATTSGKHTMFNVIVAGTHAYVAWTPGY